MNKIIMVEKEGWYTLQDIVKNKMFPWATSFWSVRKIVKSDIKNGNILQVKIIGRGRGKKYHFKGENIIKFLDKVETGELLDYKIKWQHKMR